MAGDYLKGGIWIKWGWRSNGPYVNRERLESGIRDFTAFWAKKNGVNLDDAVFEIVVKNTEVPGYWEKDFLKTQMEKPWHLIGSVRWLDKTFIVEKIDYETL